MIRKDMELVGTYNEIFEPIMIFVIPLLIVAIFSNITAFARLNHCRKLLSSKDNE